MTTTGVNAVMPPDINEGPVIIYSTLTVTIAACLTMAARWYVRVQLIRRLGWDDYTMLIAMILCVIGQIIIIPEVYYGAGRHIQYIDPAHFKSGRKLNVITQPIYLWAVCVIKMAVGFFLLRIAVRQSYRRSIIGIMVFMAVYTFGSFLTVMFQCTNIRMLWDSDVEGTCWSILTLRVLGYSYSALNIGTDIAFSVLIPILMLHGVKMSGRRKASLICIFGLGIFATAAAIVKVVYLTNYGKTGDWLWDSRDLTIWSVIECNMGIIAGNLPCLKPLFVAVLRSTYGSGSRQTHSDSVPRTFGHKKKDRASKTYTSLSSKKAQDSDFKTYGAAGEAFMLTTIDTNKLGGKDDSSRVGSGRSSSGRESTEDIIRADHTAREHNAWSGIKVTTRLDVYESQSTKDTYENRTPEERREALNMV